MAFNRSVVSLAPAGIVYDLPASQLGDHIYDSGENVVFRDGIASRVGGYSAVFGSPLFAPYFMINVRTEIYNYWVYAGINRVAVTDGAQHWDITPSGGLVDVGGFNEWTGCLLNGVVVLNNPQNDPIYWAGVPAAAAEPLPGWPAGTKCKALRAFKYNLVALNVTDANGVFGDLVLWSDAAEPNSVPNSWTPTTSNQAGFATLAATQGDIVDGMAQRDQFIIYKQTSIYSMQYTGGNLIFTFRKILDTTGLMARNCAAEVAGANILLTDSDVVIFDGNRAQSILDGRNKKWLFNQIDPVHFRNSFVVASPSNAEAWICFPSNGRELPNKALIWSSDSDSWGIRLIPDLAHIGLGIVSDGSASPTYDTALESYDDATGIYDQSTYQVVSDSLLMAAPTAPAFYGVDTSNTNDGALVSASITKLALSAGSPQQRKLLKAVYPRIEAADGTIISIRGGAHDRPNGAVLWADPVEFIVGSDLKIDCFASGRYFAVTISSQSNQPWRCTGFDLEYTNTGVF